MADHDYVCGASGLTIGHQPVRVLLLVEADYPQMVAKGEIDRGKADKAVEEFAELCHVQNVMADLEHQWKEPHAGYQSPDHEVMAKVRTDWAKLARADAKRKKLRRTSWG